VNARLLIGLFLFAIVQTSHSDNWQKIENIEYAKIDDLPLKLDLYLPQNRQIGPLIVWIHGGAWRSGSKNEMPLSKCLAEGYAAASVEYRLSTVARFPAQIHDIKAALRFLRARAGDFHLDASRIVIAGASAGGHLAALVGVSNRNSELEGKVGDYLGADSSVQGIVSYFGASDLTTILDQSTPHGLDVRVPALDLLLGGQPKDLPELAKLASPVFHVDSKDPPLLLFHGDRDPQMPINQSHELAGAYKKAGCKVNFEVVYGAGHGGGMFYDDDRLHALIDFLKENFPIEKTRSE
jgi:acetyl esterase/lipase